MTRIEDVTSGLLSKLKSGSIKMEDLNLEEIGEEVLKDCSDKDAASLSDNIAELLPVIQRSMPAGAMPQGMPQGMAPRTRNTGA